MKLETADILTLKMYLSICACERTNDLSICNIKYVCIYICV